MRKALIGILLAATVAGPVYAAPGERGERVARQDGDESVNQARAARQAERAARQEQRVERQVVRQEQRVERQQAPQAAQPQPQVQAQQGWQGRGNRGDGQNWQRRDNTGSSQQAQQGWRGRGNDAQAQQAWQDRSRTNPDREAYRRHIEETRAASAASAQGGSPALQRRAAQNQARYEQRVREERRDDRRDWRHDRRDDRRDWRQDRRDSRHSWNRGWRNDRRYDWQGYRYSNRNIFRLGGYYAPYRNHRYNRLSIGLILGSAFFGHNYWISDPWQYRLPPAYPGTRWIRYYDDVLLIDVYSGEVIDVIYDFFW